MRNDLALRPIIAKHLPPERNWETFLSGYGNEVLALKFFEFFGAGPRKFSLVKEDATALKDLAVLLRTAQSRYNSLSKVSKKLLDQEVPKRFSQTELPKPEFNSILDYEILTTGFSIQDNEEDGLNDEMAAAMAIDRDWFWELLERVSTAAESVNCTMQIEGVQKKVDWSVCATTRLAVVAWKVRTGDDAPRTAHADAPGPFGVFLEEILYELFALYDRDTESVPTARSALRALDNITSSNVEFVGNW